MDGNLNYIPNHNQQNDLFCKSKIIGRNDWTLLVCTNQPRFIKSNLQLFHPITIYFNHYDKPNTFGEIHLNLYLLVFH